MLISNNNQLINELPISYLDYVDYAVCTMPEEEAVFYLYYGTCFISRLLNSLILVWFPVQHWWAVALV